MIEVFSFFKEVLYLSASKTVKDYEIQQKDMKIEYTIFSKRQQKTTKRHEIIFLGAFKKTVKDNKEITKKKQKTMS